MNDEVVLVTFETETGTYTEVFRNYPTVDQVVTVLQSYMQKDLEEGDLKEYQDRANFIFTLKTKGLPEFTGPDWSYVNDEETDVQIGVSTTKLF